MHHRFDDALIFKHSSSDKCFTINSLMDNVLKYFTGLTDRQKHQFELLGELYRDWNSKVNVISRKDIDNLYLKHVLHSLSIARFLGDLAPSTSVLDMGTGGGFPGIPLAIAYPECSFHLVDRIGKKVNVAREIAAAVGLGNVSFQHGDIGECRDRYDYVVSRAVMPLDGLVKIAARNIARGKRPANRYANGLICLKGGDIEQESASVRYPVMEYMVNEFFSEPCFDTKKLIYVPICSK